MVGCTGVRCSDAHGLGSLCSRKNFKTNWFPFIPIWVYMTVVIVALVVVNFTKRQNYGEFEFWFALIKVIAIVVSL